MKITFILFGLIDIFEEIFGEFNFLTCIYLTIGIFVLVIIAFAIQQKKNMEIINAETDKLKLKQWRFTQSYVAPHLGFIYIDEAMQEVAVLTFSDNAKLVRTFKFEDILSCEILKDGETTYRKSTSRILLGGILLGGTGAIIGGLSSTSKKNVKVTSVELKLVIRDMQNPNWSFMFFNNAAQFMLEKALKDVNHWKDIFSIIIDKVDKDQSGKEVKKEVIQTTQTLALSENQKPGKHDIYEQLQKIANLRDSGILTDEEFSVQKAKILA